MISLRTEETEKRYKRDRETFPIGYCPFCDQRKLGDFKKEYYYWWILPNEYPYDLAFSISDLLVCKRHVKDETELTIQEYEELITIRRMVLRGEYYNLIQENAKPRRTVPPHYHIHLLTY